MTQPFVFILVFEKEVRGQIMDHVTPLQSGVCMCVYCHLWSSGGQRGAISLVGTIWGQRASR